MGCLAGCGEISKKSLTDDSGYEASVNQQLASVSSLDASRPYGLRNLRSPLATLRRAHLVDTHPNENDFAEVFSKIPGKIWFLVLGSWGEGRMIPCFTRRVGGSWFGGWVFGFRDFRAGAIGVFCGEGHGVWFVVLCSW